MRKKQVATRILCGHDSERFLESPLPGDAFGQNRGSVEQNIPELPTFSVDSMGNIVLPDGTPVIQPAGVDENLGCAVQFDLKDGALPKKIGRSFDCQPGGLETVKCTSCAARISPFVVPCEVHPVLKVIICKRCSKFYGKGCFAKDADGKDENCRWCGDGGDLICCDTCSNTFCKSCIKRNLGRTFLSNIEELGENEIWSCVICKPESLLTIQQECSEVIERIRVYNTARKKRADRTHSLLKTRVSSPQHPSTAVTFPVVVGPTAPTPISTSIIPNIDNFAAVLVSTANMFPQAADFLKNLQTVNNTAPPTIILTPSVSVPSLLPVVSPTPVLPHIPHFATAVGTCNLIQSSPITVTSSKVASSVTSSTSQDSNDSTNTRFNRGKSDSTGNNNSPDWYLQNVTVADILDQISKVDASNIQPATKALRICLETFICDLRRVETNLARSRTPAEISGIVRSFQSIYRFHMFNRVGNLISRINEENNKPDKCKIQQYQKQTPLVALPPQRQPLSQKSRLLQSKTPVVSVPPPKITLPKVPIPSKNPLTIDLTDDPDVSMESELSSESLTVGAPSSQGKVTVTTDASLICTHAAKRPQNALISETSSRKRMRPRRSCTAKPVRYVIGDDPAQDNNYASPCEEQSNEIPPAEGLQNVRQNKVRPKIRKPPISITCEDGDINKGELPSKTENDDYFQQKLICKNLPRMESAIAEKETIQKISSSEVIFKKNDVTEIAKSIGTNYGNSTGSLQFLKTPQNKIPILMSNEKAADISSKETEHSVITLSVNTLPGAGKSRDEPNSLTHLENGFSTSPKDRPVVKCPIVNE